MRDIRLSFFGDSLVAGVGDAAGIGWVGRLVAGAYAHGTPLTAYNLGVRRETSADVLRRWEDELEPRLIPGGECRVIFSFGANDATLEAGQPRMQPAASVANLGRALATARRRSLPVLVVGPPPVGDDAQQRRISALSLAFRATAAELGVPYVEVTDALRGAPDYQRQLNDGDGAHPGAAGYALIAELVMPRWLEWLAGAPAAAARDGR